MNYRVDFRLVRPNQKQNRTVFTFTVADSERDARRNVIAGHPTEKVEILGVTAA